MTTINRANEQRVRKQIGDAITSAETDIGLLQSDMTTAQSDIDALQASIGYALFAQTPEFDPVDATTYYFGTLSIAPATSGAERKVFIPRSGTITRVDLLCYAKTAGSNESWSLYVRKNDTANTLVASVSAATNLRTFSNSGLSIAVSAGDYIEFKLVCPTWATDPVGVYFGGHVYVT